MKRDGAKSESKQKNRITKWIESEQKPRNLNQLNEIHRIR